jgi:hypothetical protein
MASSGTRKSRTLPSKCRINSTFFSPRPRQVLMAFNGFGKLNAASALLTQRPAGLRNLLRAMCRTISLVGNKFFVCMAIELHFFGPVPIGAIPAHSLRWKLKSRGEIEARIRENHSHRQFKPKNAGHAAGVSEYTAARFRLSPIVFLGWGEESGSCD